MKYPAAVLWDMDGTLVDSEPLWGQATYAMSEAMGRRLTPELREQTVGGSFMNTALICARHAGITLDDAAFAYYRRMLFSHVAHLFDAHLSPRPGVVSLLRELRHEGVPCAVTTNTYRCLAAHEINAVGADFFGASFCGDEVDQPKPAPDMYEAAAAWASANPADCLVFEDSAAGVAAATAAGCRVVAVCEPGDLDLPTGVVCMGEQLGAVDFNDVHIQDVCRWHSLATPLVMER